MMKTILVGSDLGEDLHKELIIRAKEVAMRSTEEEVQVLEMVELENRKIVAGRAKLANYENVQNDLRNEERRESVKKDYLTFINRIKYRTATISRLKDETVMSWKQFRVLLDNWELFGFISYSDDKRTIVQLLEKEEDIKENILKDVQNDLDLLVQKIKTVKRQFNPEEAKKLTSLERKLKLELNVSR